MGRFNSPTSVDPDLLADARTLLKGEVPRCARRPERTARIRAMGNTAALEVTLEDLANAFPDQEDLDKEDDYNDQTPLERAIREVVCDVVEGTTEDLSYATDGFSTLQNPLYRHEVRQAQRRTLEHLLRMAEEPQEESAPSLSVVGDPPAIRTAKAILEGRIPFMSSITIPYDEGSGLHNDCHLDFLFDPEPMICYYAKARAYLVGGLSLEEERAANAGDLETCARVYEEAAAEALKVLVGFVEGAESHPTPRLLRRLCVAAREELAALVAEWAAVTRRAQ